jgi:hypothetical protein
VRLREAAQAVAVDITASSILIGKSTTSPVRRSRSSAVSTSSSTQALAREAADRMTRKTIVDENRAVDLPPEPVTDLQVFGGKPASNPLPAQRAVELLRKSLVGGRIADKARLKIDRAFKERRDVVD